MNFVSFEFLVFFLIVLFGMFVTPLRFRWMIFLPASYYFYMVFKPSYGLILLSVTTIDYVAGRLMGGTEDMRKRRIFLIASLVGNLGILFYFKYFNFLFGSLQSAMDAMHAGMRFPVMDVILPIGISFHTFQSLSYTIDVYLKRVSPVRHFGKFALYVSFFPQLVAGPIERPTGLLQQFFEDRRFSLSLARRGIKTMAWGYFKKIVVADNLAPIVSAAYLHPHDFSGPSLAIATFAFAFQIYCDFSGYTDIARGSANILGYELRTNFDRPYASRSVSEFWRRWHMSLSSWFKDYVYIPLGGNRGSALFKARNVMITFLLSGLWHGANWTFVVWGGLNGLYLVLSEWFASTWEKLSFVRRIPDFVHVAWTFILVSFAWIFFRAANLHAALSLIVSIPRGIASFVHDLRSSAGIQHAIGMNVGWEHLLVAGVGLVILLVRESGFGDRMMTALSSHSPRSVRLSLYTACIFLLLLLCQMSAPQQFIYFQF